MYICWFRNGWTKHLPEHPNSLGSLFENTKYKIDQTHLDTLQFDHR